MSAWHWTVLNALPAWPLRVSSWRMNTPKKQIPKHCMDELMLPCRWALLPLFPFIFSILWLLALRFISICPHFTLSSREKSQVCVREGCRKTGRTKEKELVKRMAGDVVEPEFLTVWENECLTRNEMPSEWGRIRGPGISYPELPLLSPEDRWDCSSWERDRDRERAPYTFPHAKGFKDAVLYQCWNARMHASRVLASGGTLLC